MSTYTLLHQNKGNTAVGFQLLCSDCSYERTVDLPLELSIHVGDRACDGTGLFLNGNELAHTWNDHHGYGSGIISSYLGDSHGILAAKWQSACIRPLGSSNEPTCQLLTVLMDPASEFDAQDEFGFTVLFTQTEPPEMLCLCTQPWNLSVDGSFADHWMNLDGSECLEIQSDASHPGGGQSRKYLEWH